MRTMSSTKTFVQEFKTYNDFLYYYLNCGIPTTIAYDVEANNSSLKTLYYLLYAKYGNSFITNWDENQWRYKVFSIIFQYGPTWEKRLDLQDKIRNLSDEDLLKGAKAVYNHAFNPSDEPVDTELNYINEQNTTNYKKSKMDAYTQLWGLLVTDVTEQFISRFSELFKKVIAPYTYIYESEENDND